MVARQVLEVLAEERLVEEGDDAAVGRDDLGALIGDALHLARDAVALDVVAHTQAARHQREAVEEVLDEVLHGEAQTRSQAGGDDGDAALGHIEQDEHRDGVEAPDDDGDDVAREGEVVHPFRRGHLLAIGDVEAAQGVVEIAEDEPQGHHHAELEERHLDEVGLVDEILEENLHAKARHGEDLRRPVDADEHGIDGQDGH